MPPWFPTSPPKNPDNVPPSRRQAPVSGSGTRRRASSVAPARTRSEASTIVSAGLASRDCRAAPINPPAALAMPNCLKVGRCTSDRNRKNRMVVANACGIATTATACAVGIDSIRMGVRRLPIPNPETAAIAPATTAAAPKNQGESRMSPPATPSEARPSDPRATPGVPAGTLPRRPRERGRRSPPRT